MRITKAKILRIAQTSINENPLQSMLEELNAPEWTTDAKSDGETLIEAAGRLCYKSFAVGLNPNVTKVREGNHEYIGNILKQRHGSVLEHGSVTYACLNVSRVFTHELVRHRVASFSQESLRFVRLTDLGAYYPDVFDAHPQKHRIHQMFKATFEMLEGIQRNISDLLDLDNKNLPFDVKKKLTSAMRRLAPIGLTTNIIVTANHRMWRHMIEMRTSPGAEEEIRKIFTIIAEDLKLEFPAIYQDMERLIDADDIPYYTFKSGRV